MMRTCPTHGIRLQGGPVWFRCDEGHSLPAADLSHDFQPRAVSVAPAPAQAGGARS